MDCLVYITNYEGNKRAGLVNRLLGAYEKITSINFDVIIYTVESLKLDTLRRLNVDIRMQPRLFSESRYATPERPEPEFIWLHRRDLLEKIGSYDLFIHAEDDVQFTEENIMAFLEHSSFLPGGYIPGHIVSEFVDRQIYLPPFHAHYAETPIKKLFNFNGTLYFSATNDHQASWIATKKHMERCLASAKYSPEPRLIPPYNIKCSACSELYVNCDLEKVTPVKDLQRFLLRHLAKKYYKIWDILTLPQLESKIEAYRKTAEYRL